MIRTPRKSFEIKKFIRSLVCNITPAEVKQAIAVILNAVAAAKAGAP